MKGKIKETRDRNKQITIQEQKKQTTNKKRGLKKSKKNETLVAIDYYQILKTPY